MSDEVFYFWRGRTVQLLKKDKSLGELAFALPLRVFSVLIS